MGNQGSTQAKNHKRLSIPPRGAGGGPTTAADREKYRSFPGSALLEKTFCGSIDTTDPSEYEGVGFTGRMMRKADVMCLSNSDVDDSDSDDDSRRGVEEHQNINPSSALLARALVSEVTDNPKTMKPAAMAQREFKLLKAQHAAEKESNKSLNKNGVGTIVGIPGGVGPPRVFQSVAYACTGDDTAAGICVSPGNPNNGLTTTANGNHVVTIGLSMSRRQSVGHPDTVTRQTAYDWNELQDRQYKYVSSTDNYGWRAGGGEKGGVPAELELDAASPSTANHHHKEASPDTTYIPIIQIECPNEQAIDQVIRVLASGDIFIPHMAVQPEALSVNGVSPPDLVVRFGCERHDDLPPDEWPNWALEFMHNQLYEYFYNTNPSGTPNALTPRWMKRPFSITLARKVRWKTVKHMNRYFSHAERVIDQWREKGPQYLDPQLAHIEGGASSEEVARPHGLYLFRGSSGAPTNYFCPNFEPPYTTKMTRSLLLNVLDKSWDKKRREWTNAPVPRVVTPSMLVAVACGCADGQTGGYLARQATESNNSQIYNQHTALSSSNSMTLLQQQQQLDQEESVTSTINSDNPYIQKQQQQQQQRPKYSQEEKKIEHEHPQHVHHHQLPQHLVNAASPRDGSMGAGYAASAAASGTATTVVHTNTAAASTAVQSTMPKSRQSQQLPDNNMFSLPSSSSPKTNTPLGGTSVSPMFSVGTSPSTKNRKSLTPRRTPSPKPQQQLSPHQQQLRVQPENPVRVDNDPPGEKVSPTASPRRSEFTKLTTTATESALDRERQHHSELIAKVKQTAGKGMGLSAEQRLQATAAANAALYAMHSPTSGLSSRGSAISLDYSTDGSSALLTNDGSSMLGGVQFDQSDSHTQASGLSTPNNATAALIQQQQHKQLASVQEQAETTHDHIDEIGSDSNFSLDDSATSVVPTDEELFAVGWAKAVDPNSGNYYYFTLDRSRTVWENPLLLMDD